MYFLLSQQKDFESLSNKDVLNQGEEDMCSSDWVRFLPH